MIAHRLKTVRHADNVLVFDGGKIVQNDTNDELIGEDGTYRRFVQLRELDVGSESIIFINLKRGEIL